MKRFMALCIAILILPSFAFICFANDITIESNNVARQIADSLILQFGSYDFHSSSFLSNTSGDPEAICFNYSPYGYVIVNINDYSVPEFSPTSVSPFPCLNNSGLDYIYNGPLNYYTYNNGTFSCMKTNQEINYEDFNYHYSVETNPYEKLNALRPGSQNRGSSVSVTTSYLPVTWTSDAACAVDGCAIVLKYLHDYKDSNLIPSEVNANILLHSFLINAAVIPNTGTYAYHLVDGCTYSGKTYVGLNRYFTVQGSSIRAYYNTYSSSLHSNIQSSVLSDYPMLIGTDPATDWSYNNHWIIVYGYYGSTNIDYFIINDGFGSNNIYVTSAADHYDDIIFFN